MSRPTMTSLQAEINNLKSTIEDLSSRLSRLETGIYAGMGSIILLMATQIFMR
jgi:hypothetical protein|tara:strand:+ start:4699 stop:4857 length:159 start_codon:yes stop_codon:yes gene_type:complete